MCTTHSSIIYDAEKLSKTVGSAAPLATPCLRHWKSGQQTFCFLFFYSLPIQWNTQILNQSKCRRLLVPLFISKKKLGLLKTKGGMLLIKQFKKRPKLQAKTFRFLLDTIVEFKTLNYFINIKSYKIPTSFRYQCICIEKHKEMIVDDLWTSVPFKLLKFPVLIRLKVVPS